MARGRRFIAGRPTGRQRLNCAASVFARSSALIKPRTPPGVMELLPRDQVAFQRMLDTIRLTFERFGFLPVETPVFELSRSEEHTSELQSLMRISYAVFCLKKKKTNKDQSNL